MQSEYKFFENLDYEEIRPSMLTGRWTGWHYPPTGLTEYPVRMTSQILFEVSTSQSTVNFSWAIERMVLLRKQRIVGR